MNTTTRWRKTGKAFRLADEFSTLWVKRIDREWHLLTRHDNGLVGGWSTLGVYGTLTQAQAEGTALMSEVTA